MTRPRDVNLRKLYTRLVTSASEEVRLVISALEEVCYTNELRGGKKIQVTYITTFGIKIQI